jgi:hypothetical protein
MEGFSPPGAGQPCILNPVPAQKTTDPNMKTGEWHPHPAKKPRGRRRNRRRSMRSHPWNSQGRWESQPAGKPRLTQKSACGAAMRAARDLPQRGITWTTPGVSHREKDGLDSRSCPRTRPGCGRFPWRCTGSDPLPATGSSRWQRDGPGSLWRNRERP